MRNNRDEGFCLLLRIAWRKYKRPRDCSFNNSRFDNFVIQRDRQVVANARASVSLKGSKFLALHYAIDLRSPGCIMDYRKGAEIKVSIGKGRFVAGIIPHKPGRIVIG